MRPAAKPVRDQPPVVYWEYGGSAPQLFERGSDVVETAIGGLR
jgi:hypothetical protein